ncbi:hypothetical protein ALO59_102500 [Pseudomonas amygdali pv. mellea]|nr:hypothetical protein ALO51_102553 [Pseudomonas amygdali]KPX78161.1 hypothetical protein ALO59_102500 [Pseudomonas amygdali pv. mellea]
MDSFSELLALQVVLQPDREQQNCPEAAPELVGSHDESLVSAQKNTFALGPACGPLKKAVKGQVAKNNNRPPEKQKRA